MPVFRPTANCIWNSFRNSGKRHILLTGGRKSGKTTLLASMFEHPLPGITTWAEPKRAVYLKENGTQNIAQVGAFNDALPGTENKMVLCQDGFKTLGIPALSRCNEAKGTWVSIDEIGYLESGCEAYLDEIRELMNQKRLIAAVRRQELPYLRELCGRDDVFLVDLDAPYGKNGCVIMASGLGTRFGGNKLMADFQGEPLICRILEATEGIFMKRVVVTRHEEVAALSRERGIDVILHELPHRSDTVRLGMERMSDVESCMFCPGDQPLLRRESVAALALAAANRKEIIWRTAFNEVPGSPVVFPEWTFPELMDLPEGKGGSVVIKKYPGHLRTVNVRDKYELLDIDRPEDLFMLHPSGAECLTESQP